MQIPQLLTPNHSSLYCALVGGECEITKRFQAREFMWDHLCRLTLIFIKEQENNNKKTWKKTTSYKHLKNTKKTDTIEKEDISFNLFNDGMIALINKQNLCSCQILWHWRIYDLKSWITVNTHTHTHIWLTIFRKDLNF